MHNGARRDSAGHEPPAETSCVDAYERELDYLFETLQRLGAGPREVEDLAQEVFVVLHRNWPTLDTTRPLRPYLFGVAFRIVSPRLRNASTCSFAMFRSGPFATEFRFPRSVLLPRLQQTVSP